MGLKGKDYYSMDYDRARKFYRRGIFDKHILQNEYGPAFLTTNENLPEMISVYGNVTGDILTVAASGDQPMFYVANGARSVKTFDMTFSAKAVMDMKTVALRQMSYDVYIKFLENIAAVQPRRSRPGDLMAVDGMADIVQKMPDASAEYIRQMRKCNIFSWGVSLPCFPTKDEYNKFQSVIKEPFDFAWTDLGAVRVATRDMKYDVINISNILEWMEIPEGTFVVSELFRYLNPNGYILASAFRPRFGTTGDVMRYVAGYYEDKSVLNYTYLKHMGLFALRRMR